MAQSGIELKHLYLSSFSTISYLILVVSLFLAFARLLFILYKLTATAVIFSFDVLARNKFFRKHETNCL